MKQHMMIIGCEILHASTEFTVFELTLVPLTTAKVKTGLLSLASGGMEGLMNAAAKQQQQKTKIYIDQNEWKDRGYKIGRHVTLELLPDDTTGGIK